MFESFKVDGAHEYVFYAPLNDVTGVEEAAELWGLSPGTIKNYCAEGKIEARKNEKTWIINKNKKNPRQPNDEQQQ